MGVIRALRREHGVTLIEFVIMLAVLGLVLGGIYQFVAVSYTHLTLPTICSV